MTEQVKALRVRGFQRSMLAEGTGDILLSFIDQNGDEQWLQLPPDSLGPLAAGLMLAAAEAAKRGTLQSPGYVEKTIQTGMSLQSYQISISLDKTLAILTMRMSSGLTFELLLTPEHLTRLRTDMRRIESALTPGKPQRRRRH